MGLFGAIAGIAAPILGGVVGGIASKGDKKRANKDRDAALGQYNIGAPTLGNAYRERLGDPGNVTYSKARAGQAAYGPMVSAGKTGYDRVSARQTGYDRVSAERTGYDRVKGRDIFADSVDAPVLSKRDMLKSEFGEMYEDPRMRQAQLGILDRYEQMSRDGLTPEDRAALYGIQKQQEAAVRAQRQGIQSQMMRAGTFGSGLQLAMQLQGAQDQNELAMMQAMETGAQSHAARREGLAGAAGMAGQIRGQDFTMAAERAHALDDMSRYNEDSAQRYEMANADFEMRASLANQDSNLRARLANQSTDLQGQMANQATRLSSDQGNANRSLQAGMANQSTRLASDQGNADRSLRAGMANQSTRLQSDQGNRDAQLRAAMSNQGMISGTNQFNAGQRTSASIHNSGMSLQSSMQNIENRMKTNMFNSEAGWQEQMAAREAQQWQWAQQLGLADRRSGIYMDRANMYDQRAQDTRNAWAGMGAGAGSLIGGFFGKPPI